MSDQNRGKTGVVILLAVVAVLVLAMAGMVIYAANYQGIFPNTYIGECNVGGMSVDEAAERLRETYRQESIAGNTIALTYKENTAELVLDEMKMAFDHQASAEEALAKSEIPNVFAKTWELAKSFCGKTTAMPVMTFDEKMLEDAILQVAGKYETEPVDYTYEITEKKLTLYNKKDGKKVDRAKLVQELVNKVCVGDFSEIVAAPVAIQPEPFKVKELYKTLTSKLEEASYQKGEDGMIKVRPGKYQCKVDKTALEEAIAGLETSGKAKATLKVATTAPKNTTEALTQHLYQDVLGEYTTYYSGTAARNSNVKLATSRINGIEMMPGDEFSYDKTILPRNAKNGYQAAPVYVGNKVESGMGGGICQPSSTLYGAVLYANLEILERHNHSMLVSYMPAGLDATIAEGYLDLRFKNSTKYPVKIEATAEGGKLTIRILGYNPENISVELIRNGGGFHYTATRVVLKDGKEISREKLGSSKYSPKEEEPEEEEKPEEEKTENPETTEETPETQQPEGDTSAESVPSEPAPAPEPVPAPEFTVPDSGTVKE